MFRRTLIWTISGLLLPGSVLALEPGDPAPALSIERWISGAPVRALSNSAGTPTVVSFWATWSTPALDSLAQLGRIAADLGPAKVIVVAVTSESASQVREFFNVNPQRKPAGVRLAVDDRQQTAQAYMRAAGQNALPHAFVVNGKGTVVWHGHPDDARAVLDSLIAGNFNMAAPPGPEPTPAVTEIDRETLDELNAAVMSQDWRTAVALIDRIILRYPDVAGIEDLMGNKFMILYERLRDHTAAEDFARILLKDHPDKARALNNIAWSLLARGDFESLDHRWPDVAHQAARRAYDVTKGEDPAILDTYARSMYLLGRVEQARINQQKAVDRLQQAIDGLPSDVDPQVVSEMKSVQAVMQSTLEYYEEILKIRERTSR